MGGLAPRFGVLVLLLVVAAGGVASVIKLQRQIEVQADRSAEVSARLVTALTVQRNLSVQDGVAQLPRSTHADLDGDVAQLEAGAHLSGLEVWDSSGHLLYANAQHPQEEQTMPLDELRKGLRDEAYAVHSDDGGRGYPTVDVFLPLDVQSDGSVDVIVETLFPLDPINEAITRWTRLLYGAAALVALLVVAGVWRLRRRQLLHQHAASHDPLTGLGNRTLLAERADHVLSSEQERRTALLLIDLDDFKEINDVLGHHAGDDLLVAVASSLRAACREPDTVVRLGGDEFAVLMQNLPTTEDAVRAAEHVLAKLREPVAISGLAVQADASIGIALAPDHGHDLGVLLSRADVAMYQAKRQKTHVALFDPQTDPRESQQLALLAELREAIPRGELELYYQPKCATSGDITEVEALIRWNHPVRGLLAPAAFMALAERTVMIEQLTAWVLDAAAQQCATWRAQGFDLRVAVNVSARNLMDDKLPAAILDAVTRAGIPISSLRVEITETAVLVDPERARTILEGLCSMGVDIAIDDFGAGYTSLSYLKTLPAQDLKIDRTFIADMLYSEADQAVVGNVIRLARDLGMTSVAEGVESPAVWARLAELGCDEIQGYVLTPPLPAGKIISWMSDWNDAGDRKAMIDAVATAPEPSAIPPRPRSEQQQGQPAVDIPSG